MAAKSDFPDTTLCRKFMFDFFLTQTLSEGFWEIQNVHEICVCVDILPSLRILLVHFTWHLLA